jgi:hypothetical protein
MLMFSKCSAARAIANGLCYYAFYAHNPTNNIVVAAAVADVTWCVCNPSPFSKILLAYKHTLDPRSWTLIL